MPVEAGEVLTTIYEVIEGGGGLVGEAVEIVTDSGIKIAEGTATAVETTNGTAATVTSISEAGGAASGAGLLAIDVGVAGAMVAPLLGIAAGYGLYNLAPEFWTSVSNKLIEAGQTIGGKVLGIVTKDGTKGLSEETIEIFKNAFIDANMLNVSTGDITGNDIEGITQFLTPIPITTVSVTQYIRYSVYEVFNNQYRGVDYTDPVYCVAIKGSYEANDWVTLFCSRSPASIEVRRLNGDYVSTHALVAAIVTLLGVTYTTYLYLDRMAKWAFSDDGNYAISNIGDDAESFNSKLSEFSLYITGGTIGGNSNPNLEPDATYPSRNVPFPQTYPNYQPIELPQTMPSTVPVFYPVELPSSNPSQEQALDPDPNPLPDPQLEFLLKTLPIPDPIPDLQIQPQVSPDPDPLPEPQPAPKPLEVPQQIDPIDPNPTPQPNPLPVVFPSLDTVNSTKLFTVYAPTQGQLDDLGGFLWSSNIIDEIKKIWQNPLDGIISLAKVYVTPTTGSSHNIILGNLDSEVSSLVVTSQFVDVNCGSVDIPEEKRNATDYSPYSTVHIYLPFIGIHELDVDEIMGGTIRVLYHVDVYTGTCLADILLTRSPDVTTEKVIYTFSGNCSQSLPLTSSSAAGMIHAILGLGAGAISVAGGGALGAIAAASMVGQSLTHEMLHVGHSGNLSANAGIMGQRKPFVIISRRHGYDANGYNDYYGYPSNKTVYLSNCAGFVRIKDIKLHCPCTDAEENEIIALLGSGVYL